MSLAEYELASEESALDLKFTPDQSVALACGESDYTGSWGTNLASVSRLALLREAGKNILRLVWQGICI